MDAAPRIRSLLFVPGDAKAKIAKAKASAADALILDLEDAVSPAAKAEAREIVREALLAEGDKPLIVRLNAFDTGMTAADLAAVMPGCPWGVMLPKAAGAADLLRLSHYLDALEAREGIAPGRTRILTVATETAAATLALASPQGCDRLWGMLWGGEDLSADLGASANRDQAGAYTPPFQFARTHCLFAARAAGVTPVDAVFTDFRDAEELERETLMAVRDGFTAKAAIHPAQCAVINRVMTPDGAQVDWAQRVVELVSATGVAQMDGKMVDIAHLRIARGILSRAGLATPA
jgi:citrate lyase subunit beta/citryl-CoA lyase